MKVIIHAQEKRFYLAADGWIPMVGNEIIIGKHSFCATPNGDAFSSEIIFSEVTSGSRVMAVDLDFFDVIILDEKRKYIEFLASQVSKLVKRLDTIKNLDDKILNMEYIAVSSFGPKPPSEEIDFDKEIERVSQ